MHALALPQVFLNAPLRTDSDTAAMLDAVQRTGGLIGAWRWLLGDWLLENGFYRPITSLSIVLDHVLYGETSWGFRLTNWLLTVFTALGVFVLTRAYACLVGYARADWLALGVATMLSLQQTGVVQRLSEWSAWWFVGAVGITALLLAKFDTSYPATSNNLASYIRAPLRAERSIRTRSKGEWLPLALAVGALFWGFDRVLETHYTRLITWVPSRTALFGTMFSVWAVYCLLRGAAERRWGWLGLGGLLYLLALGSYEQPIMLIPVFIGLAFWRRHEWGAWGWRAVGITALAGLLVLALRISLLPTEPTRYQQQQLRSSLSGPLNSYLTELVPPLTQLNYWRAVGVDFEVLLVDKQGWDHIVGTLLYFGVLSAFWCERRLLGGALLWHALTFLPMAFLHFFEHYMYLPQLGKTLTDVGLAAWGMNRLKDCWRSRAA